MSASLYLCVIECFVTAVFTGSGVKSEQKREALYKKLKMLYSNIFSVSKHCQKYQ